MTISRRTEAIVHLDRLKSNIAEIKKLIGPDVLLTAVLKGDAYGHGIEGVYPTLKECGVNSFAVAVTSEAIRLREIAGEDAYIMVLGDTPDGAFPDLVKYGIAPTIFDVDTARKISEVAKSNGKILPIEIKIDTGMSRIGFHAGEEAVKAVCEIAAMPNLRIEGCFTHFACADDFSTDMTEKQLKSFLQTVSEIRTKGVEIPKLHTANSPAVMLRPETYLDAVRPGDIIFGLCPVDEETWKASGFKEVMTWESYVALVKTIDAGDTVGYGATFTAKKPTRVATIPVGFADGYSRQLSNKGLAVINGQKAPIIGRVCMDQFMVDVSEIDGVERGTKVELLGEKFGILDMANLLDKNVDEIVCGITARVPRSYEK